MRPYVLGVTGGIGSGKSSVSRLLSSYCLVPLVDIDACCRHLLNIEQPGWYALRSAFGSGDLFCSDGTVDRKTLRERIFNDADFRRQVNGLLHPLARDVMSKQIERLNTPLVLIEIPLLFEAGWQQDVDAVLVVYARKAVRCLRIMRRDGVSRREAAKAIAAQMDLRQKAERADYLIDNSQAWSRTRSDVVALGNLLSKQFPCSFC